MRGKVLKLTTPIFGLGLWSKITKNRFSSYCDLMGVEIGVIEAAEQVSRVILTVYCFILPIKAIIAILWLNVILEFFNFSFFVELGLLGCRNRGI